MRVPTIVMFDATDIIEIAQENLKQAWIQAPVILAAFHQMQARHSRSSRLHQRTPYQQPSQLLATLLKRHPPGHAAMKVQQHLSLVQMLKTLMPSSQQRDQREEQNAGLNMRAPAAAHLMQLHTMSDRVLRDLPSFRCSTRTTLLTLIAFIVVVCSCAFILISTKSTNHWFLQALQSASEATHLYRLMLALVLPVLSRSMMWNHAIGALTPGIRSAPLVQLVLLQLFLLQAALLAAMLGLGTTKKDAKVRKICHH